MFTQRRHIAWFGPRLWNAVSFKRRAPVSYISARSFGGRRGCYRKNDTVTCIIARCNASLRTISLWPWVTYEWIGLVLKSQSQERLSRRVRCI